MSKEAMQMALHTLEGWANYGNWVWPESALEQAKRNTTESIAALRQALDTEQEPVAWITNGGKGELWWHRSSKFDEEGNLIGPNPDDIPLYTAPPKREWVRLTEKEIRAMAKPDHGAGIDLTGRMWVFIADLTDKLKEKNA